MTDAAATSIGAVSRPSWLVHPILAWRTYQTVLAARADDQARVVGLAVEASRGGVRRYRDPRFDQPDQLATRHVVHPVGVTAARSTPTLIVGASQTCSASYHNHAADLPGLPVQAVGPATPATSMTGHLRRTELLAGAGAVPDPPLPHQAGCATSFPVGSAEQRSAGKHVPVRLDPGDPAGPVPGAPRAGAHTTPARLSTGPTTTAGGPS